MNITRQETGKIGGLRQVFFVDLADVLRMPDVQGLITFGDVELREGATWFQMEGQVQTPKLDGQGSSGQSGSSYELMVQGFWAGDHPDAEMALMRMNGRQHLVLVREHAGGLMRLAGDLVAGLRFSWSYRSGERVAITRGVSWSFSAPTRKPAYYYAGAFEVSELGLQTGAYTTIVYVEVPGGGGTDGDVIGDGDDVIGWT